MITFTAKGWTDEGLAKRLGLMFIGNDQVWYQADARKWQIGAGNNFWLHPEGEGRYRLHYRLWDREKNDAVALILEWRLSGVRIERGNQVSA